MDVVWRLQRLLLVPIWLRLITSTISLINILSTSPLRSLVMVPSSLCKAKNGLDNSVINKCVFMLTNCFVFVPNAVLLKDPIIPYNHLFRSLLSNIKDIPCNIHKYMYYYYDRKEVGTNFSSLSPHCLWRNTIHSHIIRTVYQTNGNEWTPSNNPLSLLIHEVNSMIYIWTLNTVIWGTVTRSDRSESCLWRSERM